MAKSTPVALNILCFRVSGAGNHLQEAVVSDLQERRLAASSLTTIAGAKAIRAAIINHRTTTRHADRFIERLMAATSDALKAAGHREAVRQRRH
jgi:hypothetical protein